MFCGFKKVLCDCDKFQSYKFQSCYGLNIQQMQILHGLPKEEYLSLIKLLFIYKELH